MKKIARFASVLCCLAFCVAAWHPAAAAERGLYVGGYAGQSSKDAPRDFYELFNDDIQFFSFFTPTQESTSFDDSDTAFGLIIGYRLTPHLAFEGGYTKLGQVTYTSRSSGNFPMEAGELDVNIESETTGFIFAAVGVLPLSRDWELFARAGVLFADTKIQIGVNARGNQFVPPLGNRLAGSESQGTTNACAGVGLSRRFLETYSLRLEYQRVFEVGDENSGGKGDLDAALLGVIVTF
jgi:opacity protein-like surface antigen